MKHLEIIKFRGPVDGFGSATAVTYEVITRPYCKVASFISRLDAELFLKVKIAEMASSEGVVVALEEVEKYIEEGRE